MTDFVKFIVCIKVLALLSPNWPFFQLSLLLHCHKWLCLWLQVKTRGQIVSQILHFHSTHLYFTCFESLVSLQLSELWLQIYLYIFVYTRIWSLLKLLFEHWKLALPSWCLFESLTLCSQCIMVKDWTTFTRLCLYSHVTSWQALSILLIAIFIIRHITAFSEGGCLKVGEDNSKWEPKS